ncbi:MAG: hypothetical protein OEV06_10580 [Anaerolineae bacterium]|nr:hypothetical protein [Anaerolineae bacterium]
MNSKTLLIIFGVIAIVVVAAGAWGYSMYSGATNFLGLNTVDEEAFTRVQDDYVLRPEDIESSYYVDSGGEKRWANRSVILEMGEVPGKSYVAATGRVDGWYINLRRSDRTDITPATITNTVEVFEKSSGARLALSEEYFKAYHDEDEAFEFIDRSCNFGSECILYTSEEFHPGSGLTTMRYDIAFVYKNVLVWISATGLDIELNQDDVIELAEIILDKLETFEG